LPNATGTVIFQGRWVLNTVATFGGIHFYIQWVEYLGASSGSVLIAGLLALGFCGTLNYEQ